MGKIFNNDPIQTLIKDLTINLLKIVSEYDQEKTQSQTTDKILDIF